MIDTYLLEVAANSVASALAAQDGGAGRIELCSALELGGLTPSTAQIALTRERLRIPLYVLIRPRAGDFLYGDLECEVMLRDHRALLVYNPTRHGKDWWDGRGTLAVALSGDGEHWTKVLTLEDAPGAEFSYPAVIQSRDGRVHIVYTWKRLRIKHVVIDPGKL